MDSTSLTKRRNVKSGSGAVTDAHERHKDFLNEAEVVSLLEAAITPACNLRINQDGQSGGFPAIGQRFSA